jgi:hypothetical protein
MAGNRTLLQIGPSLREGTLGCGDLALRREDGWRYDAGYLWRSVSQAHQHDPPVVNPRP